MTYVRTIALVLAVMLGVTIVNTAVKNKLSELQLSADSGLPAVGSVRERDKQLTCMAQNVYYEAGHEPPEGKLAVAQVVMNRVESGRFGKDPCQVIHQKNVFYDKVVCQFSWYCENPGQKRPKNTQAYNESMEASKMVLMEGFRLPGLQDALYYHADYVNPQWGKPKVAKIGRHIFYKERI